MSNDAFLIINPYWNITSGATGRQIWHIAEGNIPLPTGTGTGYHDVYTLSTDCNIPYLTMADFAGNNVGEMTFPVLNYQVYNTGIGSPSPIGGTDRSYQLTDYPGTGLIIYPLTLSAVGYQALYGYFVMAIITEGSAPLTCEATSGFWSFGAGTIPVLTVESYTGAIGDLDVSNPVEDNIPVINSSATGYSSAFSSFAKSIPVVEISASAIIELSGTGTDATTLPSVIVAATGNLTLVGRLDVDIPSVTVVATGMNNLLGSLSVTLPQLVLSDVVKISVFGSAVLVLPELEIALSAYIIPIGTGSMSIPIFNTNKSCAVAGRFEYPVELPSDDNTEPYTLEYRRQ